MMPFYWYVLCIGTMLCWHAYDIMFMGCDSHFGAQQNYASATRDPDMSHITQKGPLGYFLSKWVFFYFLNVHHFKISLWKTE